MEFERTEYRTIIDHLHAQNVGKYIELPQIAVMGDTSSGKSSLLSAISGICFPSNDQITTRCPIRLRMEKKEAVAALVDIKWSSDGGHSWPARQLTNLDEVTSAIEAAQTFILEKAAKEVADDIVEVSVSGPHFTDLTLIDLPGIVRTLGKGEKESLIEDIRILIDTFLRNERCVILAVQPANVDFHNSQIMSDAEAVDRETKRTIPVITKPDLIDAGAEQAVWELLHGNKKAFKLGFHMVKCRNQKALNNGKTIDDGLKDEEHYFKKVEPWCRADRSLVGIPSLTTKLANLQAEMIVSSVPKILIEVREKKAVAEKKLQALGVSFQDSSDRRIFFGDVIRHVEQGFQDTLAGKSSSVVMEAVMKVEQKGGDGGNFTWRAIVEQLFTRLSDDLLMQRLANYGALKEGDRVFVVAPNGTEFQGAIKTINKSLSTTLHIDPDGRDFDVHCYTPSTYGSTAFGPKGYKEIALDSVRPVCDDIMQMMRRAQNGQLQCFLNYHVFTSIVQEMMNTTVRPLCVALFDEVCGMVSALTAKLIESSPIGRFMALRDFLAGRVTKMIAEIVETTRNYLERELRMELDPFTRNHYLFETINTTRNRHIKHQVLAVVKAATNHVGATLATTIEAIFDHNSRLSMEEHMAREMQIVVDAYGKVAVKRIMDQVPMTIKTMLESIGAALSDGRAFVLSDAELEDMMEEDGATVRARAKAQKEFDTMRKAEQAFLTVSVRDKRSSKGTSLHSFSDADTLATPPAVRR